ncbi:MAG TPA: pyridoxal-phosphate dependent enzyme [Cellvibrio sp.]|nr:pyridoxal-phosphate dependent enzyme [Cellvibrio sp.]
MDLISEDEFMQRALQVPMQRLHWALAERFGLEVVIRRDDLVDSSLSGNKFYKLFYNLQQAKSLGHRQVLSFGGAYSNHLHALAAAGRAAKFKTIAVIRGERPRLLSPMLQDIERWGTQLHFVSRAQYQQKTSCEFAEQLQSIYGDFYAVPEGGANVHGARGAQVMGWALDQRMGGDYTAACMACGTGNTLAGVAAGMLSARSGEPPLAIGFSVLKGEGHLGQNIVSHGEALGLKAPNWRLLSGYHGGGYGKKLPGYLQDFACSFERETGIDFDPVYTLKMCWGVAQLLQQGYWPRGSRLVLIHTGGLQGRRALLQS